MASIPPVPVTTPFPAQAATSNVSTPWLNWFQLLRRLLNTLNDALTAMQNGQQFTLPGPYNNDGVAASHGVAIGSLYYTLSGNVTRRIT